MTEKVIMTETPPTTTTYTHTTTTSTTKITTTYTTTTSTTTTTTTMTTTSKTTGTTTTGTTSTESVGQYCNGSGCNCLESGSKGINYIGHVSQTASHPRYGVRPCKQWSQTRFMPIDGGHHNFCRNPTGNKPRPWCVVADGSPGPKIGFCDIEECMLTASTTTTSTTRGHTSTGTTTSTTKTTTTTTKTTTTTRKTTTTTTTSRALQTSEQDPYYQDFTDEPILVTIDETMTTDLYSTDLTMTDVTGISTEQYQSDSPR